jgi:hypothetical protein
MNRGLTIGFIHGAGIEAAIVLLVLILHRFLE